VGKIPLAGDPYPQPKAKAGSPRSSIITRQLQAYTCGRLQRRSSEYRRRSNATLDKASPGAFVDGVGGLAALSRQARIQGAALRASGISTAASVVDTPPLSSALPPLISLRNWLRSPTRSKYIEIPASTRLE